VQFQTQSWKNFDVKPARGITCNAGQFREQNLLAAQILQFVLQGFETNRKMEVARANLIQWRACEDSAVTSVQIWML
jgi:hypothetical protein